MVLSIENLKFVLRSESVMVLSLGHTTPMAFAYVIFPKEFLYKDQKFLLVTKPKSSMIGRQICPQRARISEMDEKWNVTTEI